MRKAARDNFESLNQEAKDLLTGIAETEAEAAEWPEDHQPRFNTKKGTKCNRVAFDKRSKWYTNIDTPGQVPGNEVVKIDLDSNALYYC